MYERFYGLTRTPFAVTPDPAMLFMSKVHREALATIIYGVETRKGFLVCTGEVGTGKSTIIRAFFDQARADAVRLIYIFTPQVSPFEMAQYICRELGLDDPESVFAAVPRLQLKLLEEFEASRTVVLMIDEAQLLPPETLEFLRLLSNFETDTEKLIQIVLVGQPEVDTMLARRDMRQVAQRVALRARLGPFSLEESFEYIDHRLRVSGAGDLTQVMSPSAAWLIAEAGGGVPRVINILADNALIAGFGMAQRPLGSQLAGATVREFLGKSGGPGPVDRPRFATGWRAARMLRSALIREKNEPEDWVPAGPAGAARPQASGPPPTVKAERGTSAVRADSPAPVAPLRAPESDRRGGATPAPTRQPAATADNLPGAHFGVPVSVNGILVIEPEPPPSVSALPSPLAGGSAAPESSPQPTPFQADERAVTARLEPRRPVRPIAAGSTDVRNPQPARWPALSRVRTEIAPQPRRDDAQP